MQTTRKPYRPRLVTRDLPLQTFRHWFEAAPGESWLGPPHRGKLPSHVLVRSRAMRRGRALWDAYAVACDFCDAVLVVARPCAVRRTDAIVSALARGWLWSHWPAPIWDGFFACPACFEERRAKQQWPSHQ